MIRTCNRVIDSSVSRVSWSFDSLERIRPVSFSVRVIHKHEHFWHVPIGVVSKKETGDLKTALRAVLNNLKLATKLNMLRNDAVILRKPVWRTVYTDLRKGEAKNKLKDGLRHT